MSLPRWGSASTIRRTQTWYQPGLEDGFVPVVAAAVAFDPATLDWDDDDAFEVQRWPQSQWAYAPDTGGEFVPLDVLGTPTLAAFAALTGDDPTPISNVQTWYQPDTESWVPPVTRLYPFSESGYTLPVPDASWEVLAPDRGERGRSLRLTPPPVVSSGTGASTDDNAGAAGRDVHISTFISPPLLGNQRVGGSFRGIAIRAGEFAATNDLRSQVVVRVVDANGLIVRGVLYAGDAGALVSEWPVAGGSEAARRFPQVPAILTSVDALDGDRIVVEFGYHEHGADVSVSGSAYFRNFGGPDVPDDETNTSNAAVSWVEFTGIITFRGELDPATFYDPQPFVSNVQTWFAPDAAADGFVPIVVVAPFDPSTGFDWSEQPAAWAPTTWFAPEPAVEGLVPLASAFDHATLPKEEQPALWRDGTPWFTPPLPMEGLVPPTLYVPPTTGELAGIWQEEPTGQMPAPWLFADVLLGVDATTSFDPSLMDFGWDAQLDLWRPTTWFAPDAQDLGDIVRASAPVVFDPTPYDWGLTVAEWRPVLWFTPPLPAEGLTTGIVTAAAVAEQAPLWIDPQPFVDRTPRWYQPEDATEAIFPSLPVYVPPTTDGLAGLWPEQPAYWNNGTPWYNPAVDPVDGSLQSWLWWVAGGGAPVPAVLIDAETGDVFLYIGGVFIVRAS